MRAAPQALALRQGGAGEVGMNAYVYGYGPKGKERLILVDLGVAFPDMDTSPGVDLVLNPQAGFQTLTVSNVETLVGSAGAEDVTLGSLMSAGSIDLAGGSDKLTLKDGANTGTGELAVICGALVGAGLGFLWFNAPPAAVFMGDTGSLALGGALGVIAVSAHHEIVLAIVGGLFVLEAVSVIIQVAVYKRTGKRVFKMAPIHHHFEKKGWYESQVTTRFYILCVLFAVVALSTLKIR